MSKQLTAGDVRNALKGVPDDAPVKFNLSCLTEEEKQHGGTKFASIDPCGCDMRSVVFDLGANFPNPS